MNERTSAAAGRLYETNPHLFRFSAEVLSCEAWGDGFAVVLDRTAFFPTGGGQPHDEGTLNGNAVLDAVIDGDRILHRVAVPFAPGQTVTGQIDADLRLRRMANHTGEHLLSSVMLRRFGLHNVGFRMGSADVTCDFDGTVTPEELLSAADEVNRLIRENHPVTARYYSPGEAAALTYRSKLAFSGQVRLVSIGANGEIDRCACCAPHVTATGEIGLLIITDRYPYKGGLRIHLLCGADALARIRGDAACLSSLSVLLSAKPEGDAVREAVSRLFRENEDRKTALDGLNDRLNRLIAGSFAETGRPVCLFDGRTDPTALRKLASAVRENTGCLTAVFGGAEAGQRFFVLTAGEDLTAFYTRLKNRIALRGGGSDTLIRGSTAASDAEIRTAWEELTDGIVTDV